MHIYTSKVKLEKEIITDYSIDSDDLNGLLKTKCLYTHMHLQTPMYAYTDTYTNWQGIGTLHGIGRYCV